MRQREPARRAASEDRRSDGQTTEDTSASTSSATTAQSSFDDRSPSSSSSRSRPFFSTPPFLRRQERTETMVDPPSPNLLAVPPPLVGQQQPQQHRDHGLRTPPAPPNAADASTTSELSHRMATEMPEYLAPPFRNPMIARAHTDPASLYNDPAAAAAAATAAGAAAASAAGYYLPHLQDACSSSSSRHWSPRQRQQPSSPPPAYSEAIKEVTFSTEFLNECVRIYVGSKLILQFSCSPHQKSFLNAVLYYVCLQPPATLFASSSLDAAGAPPSYEEALCSARSASVRLPPHHRPPHVSFQQLMQQQQQQLQPRSLSEERTMSTSGTHSGWASSTPSRTASNSGRFSSRPLIRSSRAEEIPDVYWEQAARELDFCTCRKCQVSCRVFH